MGFKRYLEEETVAADIASVDTKLGHKEPYKHLHKGKRCKLHKEYNCQICEDDNWE